jgi:hypothetical protein
MGTAIVRTILLQGDGQNVLTARTNFSLSNTQIFNDKKFYRARFIEKATKV